MGVEQNSLGTLLIIETAAWGALTVGGTIAYLWTASKDERPRVGDSRETVCNKKIRITRRQMLLFSAVSFGLMFFGSLFTLFKVGTHVRPDDDISVNWSYLAFTAAAWVSLALLHGLYFWFPWIGQSAALAVIWGGAFAMLAGAPLSTSESKRDLLFGLSVVLQALSVVHILWFQGSKGPLFRQRGWLTAIGVLVAFVLFDLFWFLGYLNADRAATALTAPWMTHLPFFAANLLGLLVSALVAVFTYKAKKSDVDTIMAEVKDDAGVSAEGGSYVLTDTNGFAQPGTASGDAAF